MKGKRLGQAGLLSGRPAYITAIFVLLAVLGFSLLLAVTIGSVHIPIQDVYGVIVNHLFGLGDSRVYGQGEIWQ